MIIIYLRWWLRFICCLQFLWEQERRHESTLSLQWLRLIILKNLEYERDFIVCTHEKENSKGKLIAQNNYLSVVEILTSIFFSANFNFVSKSVTWINKMKFRSLTLPRHAQSPLTQSPRFMRGQIQLLPLKLISCRVAPWIFWITTYLKSSEDENMCIHPPLQKIIFLWGRGPYLPC